MDTHESDTRREDYRISRQKLKSSLRATPGWALRTAAGCALIVIIPCAVWVGLKQIWPDVVKEANFCWRGMWHGFRD